MSASIQDLNQFYYLSRSWQHRVVICVLEASSGRQSCTPNTMSCPNELTRRWTFDEHVSSGYFHFPVKKVARNTLTSSGRFISSSVSSEGLGGHDISISLQHMAFRSSRATRRMSSISDAWPSHCRCCNRATSLANWSRDKLAWIINALLLPSRSSNCNKLPNSAWSFLRRCVLEDSLVSLMPRSFK